MRSTRINCVLSEVIFVLYGEKHSIPSMEKYSIDLREITANAMRFLHDFSVDFSSHQDADFDLSGALKAFDRALESSLLPLRNHKVLLLFSGGLDSSLLAVKLNQLNIDYIPLLVANKKDMDYKNAMEVAKILDLTLQVIELDANAYEKIIPEIMKTIGTTEEKQVNISAPFYLATQYAKDNRFEVAVLGQGADELFCGYQRYVDYLAKDPDTFKDYHLEDVKKSANKNFARDDAIFSSMGIALYNPYLSESIVKLTFSLPNRALINLDSKKPIKKHFLRLYAKNLNLDEKIIQKKKVAIQFGSGSYRLLRKLALKRGFTKDFANQYGYLANAQLYLDFTAQQHGIKNFNLRLDK